MMYSKAKAIPVTGCGGPQVCETLRLPHFLDNQLTDGGEAVSLMCQPLFTTRKIPELVSVRRWVNTRAIVQMEDLGQLKNPMTSSGIKPMTLQLVAQCPNQLCCRVPQAMTYEYIIML
jgi:hypothetical protein